MSLMHVSSPHVHKPVTSVEQVMKQVLLATIPGVAVLTWFFGPGTLVNSQLYKHPLTDKGLEAFLADWEKTGQSIL